MKPRKRFGERLRQARIEHELSQSQLARKIGDKVSQTTIARYEAGKSMPKPRRMARFAEVLGKSEAWLRGLEGGYGGQVPLESADRLSHYLTDSHDSGPHALPCLDAYGEPGPGSVTFLGCNNREARTSYLICWALRAAREGRGVDYFYLDGWAGYFASELVACACDIPLSQVSQEHVRQLENEGLFENLRVYSSADRNFFEYLHSGRLKKSGVQYVFVDGLSNLSRLDLQGTFALPRREEIFANLALLKNTAVSDKLRFVTAEYVRRFQEGETPSYWSPLIGGSFDIFLDLTDAFLFLSAADGVGVPLEVLRNRGGRTGTMELQFDPSTRSFQKASDRPPAAPVPTLESKPASRSTRDCWYDEEGIAGFSLWDSAEKRAR